MANKQKTYERIKNWTTQIKVEKTISEIEKILTVFGANKILKEYDNSGNVIVITFNIFTDKGEMPIKLPLKHNKILRAFEIQVNDGKLPRRFLDNREFAYEQAYRVGWRILKDWIEAQLTLIAIDMVKFEEVFLPYIYNTKKKKTFFELVEENQINLNQITDGTNE